MLCGSQVIYHPEMTPPSEHEPKAGKRALGWLMRYLLRHPPSCNCDPCQQRYARLVGSTEHGTGSRAGGSQLADAIAEAVQKQAHSQVVAQFGQGSFKVTVAVADGPRALVCHGALPEKMALHDAVVVVPAVLGGSSQGWSHCTECAVGELMQAVAADTLHPAAMRRLAAGWLSPHQPQELEGAASQDLFCSATLQLDNGDAVSVKDLCTASSTIGEQVANSQVSVPAKFASRTFWRASEEAPFGLCVNCTQVRSTQ